MVCIIHSFLNILMVTWLTSCCCSDMRLTTD